MSYNDQQVAKGLLPLALLQWVEQQGGVATCQERWGLDADGNMGPRTIAEALRVKAGGTPVPDQAHVRAVYGDFPYKEAKNGAIAIDPEWARQNITSVKLHDNKVRWLHKLVAAEFKALYEKAVKESGYHPVSVQTYVPRHTLWNPAKPLSMHSWGIAIDFDPSHNRMGGTDVDTHGPSKLRKHPRFVEVFTDAGWEWGGSWRMKDDMHFQRARI